MNFPRPVTSQINNRAFPHPAFGSPSPRSKRGERDLDGYHHGSSCEKCRLAEVSGIVRHRETRNLATAKNLTSSDRAQSR